MELITYFFPVFRRWRYLQICFSFPNLLIRYDVPLPANAVKLCVKFLKHDASAIRKVTIVQVIPKITLINPMNLQADYMS